MLTESPVVPMTVEEQNAAAAFAAEAAKFAPLFRRASAWGADPEDVLSDFVSSAISLRWFARFDPAKCSLRGFVYRYATTFLARSRERLATRSRILHEKADRIVATRRESNAASDPVAARTARETIERLRRRLPDAIYVEALDRYIASDYNTKKAAAALGLSPRAFLGRLEVIRARAVEIGALV